MMLATATAASLRDGADHAGRPTARGEVSAFPLDGELVLYDGRTGEAHMLNSTGGHLWHLCDGSRSVTRIAREAALGFGIPYRQALADVREFVTTLTDADLITLD